MAAKDHGGHLVDQHARRRAVLRAAGDGTHDTRRHEQEQHPRVLAVPERQDVRYKRTIRFSKVVAAQIRTHNAVLIVHGIDWNRNGIYDNAALNRSDLNRSLPGEITAPALCGELIPQKQGSSTADGNQTGQAGSGEEFAVAFTREPDSPAWLCHIPGAVAGDRKSSA